ncbi:hypothetical protein Pla144_48050 [Bythopirellula polymerisocia]|uniref:Uncharacterized protein n=1 Tax=Bythopirellula polymerisocia TaxID=2528003 RepID=A0A5C6CBU6_9BACT|nr:hypothetical protein Pla144_48050 [Bythopirellula polymerisocia]
MCQNGNEQCSPALALSGGVSPPSVLADTEHPRRAALFFLTRFDMKTDLLGPQRGVALTPVFWLRLVNAATALANWQRMPVQFCTDSTKQALS